ncbi:MAG: 2-C-methyl-D-erythritol 4-phosphate cytidylyltransferase [Candidatus Rokubacteria bacterium]|nr:2-C-methyl-D-erythritol 4-phosphate cytidylyltransferase [Candidatus Rokubacteria bacterium]
MPPGMTVAVVPAAGSGSRMGGSSPKQFLLIGGIPLLARTLATLGRSRVIGGIVVVAPPSAVERTRRLIQRHRLPRVLAVVPGGRQRQESVWLGLQAVPATAELVVVHDGVRPFITGGLVRQVVQEAARFGAAACGLPVGETVKRAREGFVQATLDREGLWLVQTPQAFRRILLWEAHEKARRDGFLGTDDAVLVERLGAPVRMVAGLVENVKVTTPEDLARARSLVAPRRLR